MIEGFQGDDPGGFTAAPMLVTNYKIKSVSVWVVANLNFESIFLKLIVQYISFYLMPEIIFG